LPLRSLSRRRLLCTSVAPLFAAVPARRLKVAVTGGHPGDPECGCAGTIVRYTDLGHEVVLLYLNRGEGYCHGYDPTQCGPVRTAEAKKACQILKARPAFLSQRDGSAIVDSAHYDEVRNWLRSENPDVLFAQWPLDSHRDHRALSALVLDAWLAEGKKSALYFYEVTDDTMMFTPSEYVDISAVEERRRAACYAHISQTPDKWYPGQVELTRMRGRESGYRQAEAFLRHWQSRSGLLP
jgi:LmbE family N-acetylglucosaminyl deacetylase